MVDAKALPGTVPASLVAHFSKTASRVFTRVDLRKLLVQRREEWGLSEDQREQWLLNTLTEHLQFREVKLRSDRYAPRVVYARSDATATDIGLSLRNRSYISHATAVFIHGLTDQNPRVTYVNREQSEKPSPKGRLTQATLTRAFAGRQRMSELSYQFDGARIVLLSGKASGDLGVVELSPQGSGMLRVTGIPRTLVDIVVRPSYGGGVYGVLDAFRTAKGRVRGAEILGCLNGLKYVYPYHQAVGYLLERAGFPESDWGPFLELRSRLNFYLAHGMKQTSLVEKWRLFVPEGF